MVASRRLRGRCERNSILSHAAHLHGVILRKRFNRERRTRDSSARRFASAALEARVYGGSAQATPRGGEPRLRSSGTGLLWVGVRLDLTEAFVFGCNSLDAGG